MLFRLAEVIAAGTRHAGVMDGHASPRTLILLRHAKTEHGQGKPDADRELTERGHRDASGVGTWLHEQAGSLGIPAIDLVICSTSTRTRQTWEAACTSGAKAREVRYDGAVYNASAVRLLRLLREEVDDVDHAVLLVGHATGVPDLASLLLDPGSSANEVSQLQHGFGTATMAVFRFGASWHDLAPATAELLTFVTP